MRITRNMFKIRLEKKLSQKQVKPIAAVTPKIGKAHSEVLGEIEAINHIK